MVYSIDILIYNYNYPLVYFFNPHRTSEVTFQVTLHGSRSYGLSISELFCVFVCNTFILIPICLYKPQRQIKT